MTAIVLPGGASAEIDPAVTEVDGIFIHPNRASLRTIERWRKLVFSALRDAISQEMQEAENMLWGVLFSRYLDSAEGVSLDTLGKLVGEGRTGREDPNYRIRIRGRIFINQSFGRPSDLLGLLQILGVADALLVQVAPAELSVDLPSALPVAVTAFELPGLLAETRAAGVGLSVVMATSDDAFLFSSVGDAADPLRGFGDVVSPDPALGGTLSDRRLA